MRGEEARRSVVARISRPTANAAEGFAMKEGKLELLVRSRRVARLVEFEVPLFSPYGRAGSRTGRATVYDYVLDEQQLRVVRQAKEFAARQGLILEVTDLSKEGALRRLIRVGSAMLARGSRTPSLEPDEPKELEPVPVSSGACRT